MTKRSVTEIEQELEKCKTELKYMYSKRYLVSETNEIIHHVTNLYLELERAKNRDWYRRR